MIINEPTVIYLTRIAERTWNNPTLLNPPTLWSQRDFIPWPDVYRHGRLAVSEFEPQHQTQVQAAMVITTIQHTSISIEENSIFEYKHIPWNAAAPVKDVQRCRHRCSVRGCQQQFVAIFNGNQKWLGNARTKENELGFIVKLGSLSMIGFGWGSSPSSQVRPPEG